MKIIFRIFSLPQLLVMVTLLNKTESLKNKRC